jgi:hypothetical protein
MNNSDLIDRLTNHWLANNVRIKSGVPLDQIDLPPDFRGYFAAIDGMEQGETDSEMFSFLPLHSIKPIPEDIAQFGGTPDYTEIMKTLPDPDRWFVFVDYLLYSAVYAIRLSAPTESTPVLWVGSGRHHRVVASSFSGFVEIYLTNPHNLL